jgi:4,5-DOPA dioxygenase extradiol
MNIRKPPEFHFEMGRKLGFLRDQGVFILGSGNLVHQLRKVDWNRDAAPWPEALEFDEWTKKKLMDRDFKSLTYRFLDSEAGRWSVPTLDHYLPLLYVLGAVEDGDELKFEYEGIQNASISMRTVSFGMPQ